MAPDPGTDGGAPSARVAGDAARRRRAAFVWLGYGVAAVLLVGMAVHLHRQRDVLRELTKFSSWHLLGLAVVSVLMLVARGLVFRELARVFGLRLTPREWFGLSVVNALFSYTAASPGGALVRGTYLKLRHSFSYTEYASLLTSGQLMAFACGSAYGLLVSLVWGMDPRVPTLFAAALVVSVSAHGFLSLAARVGGGGRFPRLGTLVARFGRGFGRWKSQRTAALGFAAFCGLSMLVSAPRLTIVFATVGSPVPIVDVIALRALVGIFSVITLTPGNLGIREGLVTLCAPLFAIDPTTALFASLIDRAAGMVSIFVFGAIFSRLLLQEFAQPAANRAA